MTEPQAGSWIHVVKTVLRCELKQLLRDQRALLAAVLVPALLYPLVFLGQNALKDISDKTLAEREVNVVLDISRGDPEVTDHFRELLTAATPIALSDVDASSVLSVSEGEGSEELRGAVQGLFGEQGQLLVVSEPLRANDETDSPDSTESPDSTGSTEGLAPPAERTRFNLYYDVKSDSGREALDRARDCLNELAEGLEGDRRREILVTDPGLGLTYDGVDVASDEDASGAALGRLLPLIAVLVLLSGGSYAALAVFAGERESGTLETLLVQPVPVRTIAWAKYLAVLTAGLVTLACNLGSILVSVKLGLGSLPGFDGEGGGVGLARLASGIVYLPGAVLVCALLTLFCGRARTYREGQATILPVMIFTLLPTSIALQPDLEMDVFLAAVPMTGPALALRDALRGELAALPVAVMVLSHGLWCALLLAQLASVLDAEKVLKSPDKKTALHQGTLLSGQALRWGFVSVLAMYIIGGSLQTKDLYWGTLAQFWVLIPLLVWAISRTMSRAASVPVFRVLGTGLPRPWHFVGALCLAPGLAFVASRFGTWQQEFLPMPRGALDNPALVEAITAFPTWKLFLLMVLSPAIFEELLFRGALLFGFRHDLSRTRSLLLQAAFFAIAHASVYRLIPTFVVGLLLGALRLRTNSLWPAVFLHGAYNGLLILGMTERVPALAESNWPTWLPWLFIPGLALLMTPPREDASPAQAA